MYASLRCIPREGVRPGLVTPGRRRGQIKNLENSVENKFSLILKFIETQSQIQNQIQNQVQNQVQNQIQNQSQNQTKIYAQAATNAEEEYKLQKTKKQQDRKSVV